MNKQQRINEALRLLDSSYRITYYDPRINVHNDWRHELAKVKLIYEYKKEGKKVLAEAIFNNGGRGDIFIPEDFMIIEVLHSETMEEALSKKDYYPSECDIKFITSGEILDGVL